MKNITILIPCYNEQDSLEILYKRLSEMIGTLSQYNFMLLLVNDGSRDNTLLEMEKMRLQDKKVSVLNLSRNFGKETAMLAGLDYAEGDAVILMDADLQDPPELIPQMIAAWEEGYIDVYAQRRSRAGESWFKKFTSKLYYRILQKMTDIEMQVDVGDFRLLDRQAVEALRSIRERQRYTKGLFSWIGYRKKAITFDRAPRSAGVSKWDYWKLIGLAIDGITSFSVVPLRLGVVLGMFISFIAFMFMGFIVIRTFFYGDPVAGYPSLVSIILFLGGIQLVVLGIIGEYLGRVFAEAKKRPEYLAAEYNGEKVFKGKL